MAIVNVKKTNYNYLKMASSASNVGVDGNIFIDADNLVIKLAQYDDANDNLDLGSKGVTLQCVYTFVATQWDFSTVYPTAPFPFDPVTPEQMILIDGWDWADDVTRLLVKDGGWRVTDTAGNVTAEYPCIITQGTFGDPAHTAYYQVVEGADPIAINDPGPVNQAIKMYEVLATEADAGDYSFDAADTLDSPLSTFTSNFSIGDQVEVQGSAIGNDGVYTVLAVTDTQIQIDASVFTTGADNGITVKKVVDTRDFFRIYLREEAYKYDSYDLIVDGQTGTLSYKRYPLPLGNEADPKVTKADGVVDPYGITIQWYAAGQTFNISGTNRTFSIVIDAKGYSAEDVYMAVQSQLRKSTDIDADGTGVQRGDIADELLTFVGDDLYTVYSTSESKGVFIKNYSLDDINRLYFRDDANAEQSFDYVATLSLSFNNYLQLDPQAKYWIFHTALPYSRLLSAARADFTSVSIVGATDTITIAGGLDPRDHFIIGETLTVTGSTDLDGNYTILSMTATDIVVNEDLSAGTDETANVAITIGIANANFGKRGAQLVDQDSGSEVALLNGFTFGANTISAASGLDVFLDGDKILVLGSLDNDGLYTVSGNATATTITTVESLPGTLALDAADVIVTSKKIAGFVGGNATLAKDFNYDNNGQGGRSFPAVANVTFVARGHGTGGYFRGTGQIVRATGQVFSFVAPQERNFDAQSA